ncbi:MAG TPA: TonB family protein [Pyrinomonadaceae bacterium]|nr:TonB family protein [Pyrinomonadaceae bacterium]
MELSQVKGSRLIRSTSHLFKISFALIIVVACAAILRAQTPASDLDADGIQRRITRARALAAAGNLPAARSELEALQRTAGVDPSVREITLVLLAGIYIDQADYSYAENLLNAAFTARAAGGESAARAYFVLAGQLLGGVRARLERYRVFGLNVADDNLPTEAAGDLDRLRTLIERVFAQGQQLRDENARNMDATALLEEAAGVRVRLARKDDERARWQAEVTDARQRLIGADRRVASNGTTAPLAAPRAQASSTPTAAAGSQPVAQPSPTPSNTAPATQANAPTTRGRNAQPNTTPSEGTTRPAPANSQTTTAAAAPVAVDGKPLEVGSLLPIATDKPAPSYPPTARNARVTGRVTVFLMLDEKGAVAKVERTDGPEMLRGAAADAARRWKFRPTVVNGQPVRVSGYINFNFTL